MVCDFVVNNTCLTLKSPTSIASSPKNRHLMTLPPWFAHHPHPGCSPFLELIAPRAVWASKRFQSLDQHRSRNSEPQKCAKKQQRNTIKQYRIS